MSTALPASTDFTGAGVTEGDFKSAITALRDYLSGLMGTDGVTATALATLGAPLSGILTKSGAYSVVAGDKGRLIDCTGTWSLTLLAAATAGDGYTISVRNGGSGVITVDPNLSETVDGGATLAINAGESLILYCDGTKWLAVGKSSGVPSGAIVPFAGSSAPAGWLLCYGQAVSRTTYASLFTAISTGYGVGDGSSTFNLPDLRGRVPAGKDDMGGSAASRLTSTTMSPNGNTLAATGGAQTHTLSTAELASHTHGAGSYSVALGLGSGTNGLQPSGGYDVVGGAVTGTSASAGSGTAHANVQPSLICNYLIKT